MTIHPECQSDPSQCRIRSLGMQMATQIGWTPVYDGRGVMTNNDPNTYVTERVWDVCGARWAEERTGDDVVMKSLTAPGKGGAENG